MQVTTRQLPHHRVVRSNTHVNHRNSTSPIEVNLDILSTAFALSFSNKSTTILPKTYTNMWIYLQLSMVVSTVVWDVCRSCKRHLSSNCFDDPNVCQVQFIPSSCHFNVLGTTHKNNRFIPVHTNYCLLVSGVYSQTKKTSLHAPHRQHRQRSPVTYKSRRHILPSLSTSKRRSNRQNFLRARGASRVHLLYWQLLLSISSLTFI